MIMVPIVSRNAGLAAQVREVLSADRFAGYSPMALDNPDKAVEILQLEMPDMMVLDFWDSEEYARRVLDAVMSDSWLLSCGIIAACRDYKQIETVENMRGANIIAALPVGEFDDYFNRIMTIIHNNSRILFHREIGGDIVGSISGSFTLENDPFEARCFANLICNFLYNAGKLNAEIKMNVNMALNEMLMNAVEHGNCGITYEEKSAWLENGSPIVDLIKKKCGDPAIRDRTVFFEYSIEPDRTAILIADQGEGFDWRSMLARVANPDPLTLHGRGIIMASRFTAELAYNDRGNEVRFEIPHQSGTGMNAPAIFRDIGVVDVAPGDVVVSQGEESSSLYYIVKGQYDIIVDGATVSSLSPDDVFMGEMSFLLNDRRSATVRARSEGKLIKLTKRQFVDAIKKKPHYALFLCRLLARRIQRLNAKSARRDEPKAG